ncbi:AzlC family ABC transporter permease [Archaeoglobus profundus]|uniref:AzlC family protein n=1 Tax=Archaeoglobus profundus (strain DSM 5631 / JCM 9629 / NBRC 100127 / Av18) TaxID=572546 RepID=D2RH90_ARCPA|nr:AzlC family ABC transporter permease [Archaeoglobus profundus]ADB57665.1 AzlC family protein [Archaeoglobus profundus DSM 5631]
MIKKGIVAGIPIALGYFPVAVTFGLTAMAMGLKDYEAVLASLLIFAGSAQFALATLIDSPINATIVPILLNLRHLIYGCILSKRIKISKPFITAFGLTDEVFAMSFKGDNERFIWGLALIAYSAWVSGTVVGVLGGTFIVSNEALHRSLVFAFPALFFILLIPNRSWNLISAIFGGLIALILHILGYTSFGILLAGIVSPFVTSTLRRCLE